MSGAGPDSGKHSLWTRVFAAVFAVHLLIGLAAPERWRSTRFGDYAPQVENLQAGRGFVAEDGSVMHRYPPLYPLMLWRLDRLASKTGIALEKVLAGFAAICNAVTAAGVAAMAARLGAGSAGIGFAAALFALHPWVLYGLFLPLSETPFMAALMAALLCLSAGARSGGWRGLAFSAAGGALTGVACLIRPIALLAPAVFGVVFLWKAQGAVLRRTVLAGAVVVAAVAVLLPWELWVWQRTGEWIPISSGGPPTLRDGLSFNHKSFREQLALPSGVRAVSDAAWREYESLESTGAYFRFVLREAAKDPVAVVQTYAYKALRAWYGTDAQRARVEVFNGVVSLAFLTIVARGAWRLARRPGGSGAEAWLLFGATGLLWAMATVALSIARYMTPAVALLAPVAGAGWQRGIVEAGGEALEARGEGRGNRGI